MSNSTLITDYVGRGTHAARPVTPGPIPTGGTAFYYETDTTTMFYWSGSAWVAMSAPVAANPTATAKDTAVNGVATTFMASDSAPAIQKATSSLFGIVKVDGTTITASGGVISSTGLSAGTPPTIVQSGISTAASASITLSSAPVNGNLLVAICFNPTNNTAGTGWTFQDNDQSGTDFCSIFTKVAGAGESATQTPIGSAPTAALICMWELNGQAVSNFVLNAYAEAQDARAGSRLTSRSRALAVPSNAIFLGAVGIAGTGQTITKTSNVTVDQTANAGTTRNGVMGHSTGTTPVGQIMVAFSAAAGNKAAGIVVTA